MNALNPSLLESYYISSIISGLREDTMPMLKILKQTLFDAIFWASKIVGWV